MFIMVNLLLKNMYNSLCNCAIKYNNLVLIFITL